MVAAPNLRVLEEDHRGVELTPRSQALLHEYAKRLNLPEHIALQVALTDSLSSLQRLEPLHMALFFELEDGHKSAPPDA